MNGIIQNPYKPGSGHYPPHLAGRSREVEDFRGLIQQEIILTNMVLTGLRGVGKTVLLDKLKPLAISEKWLWVGESLSESASISEERLIIRFLTDLAVATSNMVVKREIVQGMGFASGTSSVDINLNYATLMQLYQSIPGLESDKLKGILEVVWGAVDRAGIIGIIFAYDEAQTISDHNEKEQFPLALLLDVFQSIQKKGIRFMLILAGLPTLPAKLIASRTFSERMFKIVQLSKLTQQESREAILKPLENIMVNKKPLSFTDASVKEIIRESGCYPYFIQFICKEVFDLFMQQNMRDVRVPIEAITRKLDKDFFSGRWARITDRQKELLFIVASLKNADEEFSVQEIIQESQKIGEKFTSSHVNQMLNALAEAGIIYKHRYGKYSFAVPLLGRFILRQKQESEANAPELPFGE